MRCVAPAALPRLVNALLHGVIDDAALSEKAVIQQPLAASSSKHR
jgi:hypothetical protein